MSDVRRALSSAMPAAVVVVLLLTLVAGCDGARLIPEDAWVWRRQWTPAVSSAVSTAPSSLARLRVLAVEHDPDDDGRPRAVVVDVDEAALIASGRPVVATWRIGGSALPATIDAGLVLEQIGRWRAAGVDVVGLEIDHDCATSRLAAYRAFLVGLRSSLPSDLRLAITALPTWRTDPAALGAVAAVVDEVTVQLHAIKAPRIFDAATAVDEAAAFASAAGRDVGVALPTYAARTRDGPLVRVAATDVAGVARALRRTPGVTQIAWFRLGARDDAGAFSHQTLAALVAGDALIADVVIEHTVAADGAIDVVVVNRGSAPGVVPSRVPFPRPATVAEAAPGVVVDGAAFVSADVVLAAGARRRLGWLRPATPSPTIAVPESL